jgi:hypothetical protein
MTNKHAKVAVDAAKLAGAKKAAGTAKMAEVKSSYAHDGHRWITGVPTHIESSCYRGGCHAQALFTVGPHTHSQASWHRRVCFGHATEYAYRYGIQGELSPAGMVLVSRE